MAEPRRAASNLGRILPLKDNIKLERFPLVTVVLVLVNVIAYLLEISHGGSFFGGPSESVAVHYGAIPFALTHPGSHCALETILEGERTASAVACATASHVSSLPQQSGPATWETVFTAMFLHGSFLHIFGNMVFLAIFGPTVEDATTRPRYLAFYLAGGIVALAAQVAVGPNSTAPTLGASGAIAAVLGGYLVLYPRARVLSLVFIIFFVTIVEVPSVFLLGFWFLEQLYLGVAGLANPLGGEGVAYFAHIGGFIFGLLAIRLLVRHRQPSRPVPVY
jgi:membrane associated rhomboid family serine protease